MIGMRLHAAYIEDVDFCRSNADANLMTDKRRFFIPYIKVQHPKSGA